VGRLRAYGNAINGEAATTFISAVLDAEREKRAAVVCDSGVDEFEALLG
jgi:hypothetical protein